MEVGGLQFSGVRASTRPEAIMLKILPIILFHNSCKIVQLFPIIFRLFPKILIVLTAGSEACLPLHRLPLGGVIFRDFP